MRYFFNSPTMQPPRQASPATPPQEGNCRVQRQCNRSSVFVLDISPLQEGNCLVQTRCNHSVRMRRRVQRQCNRSSVFVLDISPLQEGNCLVQTRYNPPQCICTGHLPSSGGELPGADTIQSAPVYLYWTSPLHRRGIAWCKHDATTPAGFAA